MAALDFRSDKRIGANERRQLRAFCGELGGEIVKLANDLGVKVFAEALWPYQSGYLEYAPTCGSMSNYRIVINASQPVERQRFTIAHELAHFLLHRDSDDFEIRTETKHRSSDIFIYELEPEDKKMEREANVFAAALLLPKNLFAPAHRRLDGDREQLKKLFLVSSEVIDRRCKELRLDHSGANES